MIFIVVNCDYIGLIVVHFNQNSNHFSLEHKLFRLANKSLDFTISVKEKVRTVLDRLIWQL